MKKYSISKLPIPFRYIISTAVIIGIIQITQSYVDYLMRSPDYEFGWKFASITAFTYFFLWAIVSPLIFSISIKIITYNKINFRNIITQLLIGAAFAVFQVFGASLFRAIIFLVFENQWFNPLTGHSLNSIVVGVFGSFLEYWIILGVFLAANYYKKFRDKENELNNAQLNALRMQLHPHFLFNTLHTISSLIDENKENAQAVISKLGFLLRRMLEQNREHTFTLKQELDYIKSYLDIEEIRFQDRLKIIYDINENSLNALVPSLILQPLVENAIKHGFQNKSDSGFIKILSKINDESIELIVEDNGDGKVDNNDSLSTGIGLSNVKNRLEKHYPDNYKFNIESEQGKGFIVSISFPFKSVKENKES